MRLKWPFEQQWRSKWKGADPSTYITVVYELKSEGKKSEQAAENFSLRIKLTKCYSIFFGEGKNYLKLEYSLSKSSRKHEDKDIIKHVKEFKKWHQKSYQIKVSKSHSSKIKYKKEEKN